MLKLITQPYRYFGRQCKHCGAYFVYDAVDALTSPHCPACYAPFEHSIDDPDVEIEPNTSEMKSQQAVRGEASDSVIIPEFSVGQLVYAVYRTSENAPWHYFGTTAVSRIIYFADAKKTSLYYIIENKIAGTNSTANDTIRLFSSIAQLRLSDLVPLAETESVDSSPVPDNDENE